MQLTLDQVKTLASNGSPLHVTIASPNSDTPEVHVQGRGAFPAPQNHYAGHIGLQITKALRYYPDPVTVNGIPVERYNFPNLARVTSQSYPDRNTVSPHISNLQVHPCTPPVEEPFNLLVAGVLCQLNTPPMAKATRYTPASGDHPHWQQANTLTVTAVPVITPEQLDTMDQHQWDALSNLKELTPLKVQLLREADLQVQWTLEHPGIPSLHQGPVYAYLLADSPAPAYLSYGAPIIVHRTPVVFDTGNMSQPAIVSAAETLYTTNQEFVPVASATNREFQPVPRTLHSDPDLKNQAHGVITNVDLHTQPQENFSTPPVIRKLDQIAMTITLKDTEQTFTLPASFWFLGETIHDRLILHANPNLTTGTLTDAILRAYWRDDNIASKDQEEWELEQAEYDAMFMAQAALQDPVQAYADQLKRYIDIFPTDIPFPSTPITFTTQSGTITVTLAPDFRTNAP